MNASIPLSNSSAPNIYESAALVKTHSPDSLTGIRSHLAPKGRLPILNQGPPPIKSGWSRPANIAGPSAGNIYPEGYRDGVRPL